MLLLSQKFNSFYKPHKEAKKSMQVQQKSK
jgi:hypothetical protein